MRVSWASAVQTTCRRAIAMGRVLRDEVASAPQACSRPPVAPVLPAAVCIQRRGAVRTNDLEVLEPVVRGYAIDVVQDQSHLAPAPLLALAAQLAHSVL